MCLKKSILIKWSSVAAYKLCLKCARLGHLFTDTFFFFLYIFGHFSMVNWMLRVCRMLGGMTETNGKEIWVGIGK